MHVYGMLYDVDIYIFDDYIMERQGKYIIEIKGA
jgi:hypothetical protein